MNIRIIAVGKVKEKFLQEGIAEYEKRLRPYVKLQVIEIGEEKRPQPGSQATEAAAMEKEGQRILSAVPAGSLVVCLDVQGEPVTSEGFSARFREWELAGKNPVVFVIGGDLGLSPEIREQSALRISLSPMTFTHPMARFILMEQIYRAFRILRGEPYHK